MVLADRGITMHSIEEHGQNASFQFWIWFNSNGRKSCTRQHCEERTWTNHRTISDGNETLSENASDSIRFKYRSCQWKTDSELTIRTKQGTVINLGTLLPFSPVRVSNKWFPGRMTDHVIGNSPSNSKWIQWGFTELPKLFEREMCSENISGIIQNNLAAPKSKAHQIQWEISRDGRILIGQEDCI
jgi:hypothetical protein